MQLAKEFDGEIISADSRQVYREMDIMTGKDVKKLKYQISDLRLGNRRIGFYTDGKIKIWGYDIVEPNQEWSASHFVKLANTVIGYLRRKHKLPIAAAGTGLYLRSLISPPQTIDVPPNHQLREKLSPLSVNDLQSWLRRLNQQRLEAMNNSDRKNPRRLIRAIEVLSFNIDSLSEKRLEFAVLQIILTAQLSKLDRLIKQRLMKRLDLGGLDEVKRLAKQYGWNSVLAHTIGYQEWQAYLAGKTTHKKAVAEWLTHEKQYARRQRTWFAKQSPVIQLEIGDIQGKQKVVREVRRWYDGVHAVNE